MKMKRDDLLMIILTVVVVVGGLSYYMATQLASGPAADSGDGGSGTVTQSLGEVSPAGEPTPGEESGSPAEAGRPAEGRALPESTQTVHIILNNFESVIGGTINGNWVDAATVGHYLQGGEVYKYYLDAECVGERAGAAFDQELDFNEVDNTYRIQMQEGPEPIAEYTFAMTGAWNPFIRKAQPVNDTGRFTSAVKRFLNEHSVTDAEVVIREAKRIDIEGDGTQEFVILASNCTEADADNLANGVEFSRQNKYSFVILEKAGQNILLLKRTQSINDITITCADLDGDKEVELLIHDENYETLAIEGYSIGYDTILKVRGDTAYEVAAVSTTPL